ncbi:uncharacterized protein LOC128999552 [Macrosteles quadrilineatus]|uniref:uncharacterized protein LOC128999552 n=1 Tax=Macrosteles quadrilineatus TaxID=74068 RepID=UPI0023E10C44|nr:uncharacterized protein LOC128999552 [Macrosteles quadrilineatus]
MFFVPKLTFFVYIALKLSAVYSSIHFDEVEFYDPNKTLDESTSNGFICAHLGEECQISAQCCGVATCALPSWSEKAVCLVPGYKHDERFRNRFFALHHLQPADIQYIRDSYNTSQYDFLLTDLTFSAPPLEVANTSLGLAANLTVEDVSAEDFGDGGRNHSVEPVPKFSKTEELYNNSYIFMVHKEHLDEPAQLSSWKKVVNFFHREKGQPVTLDVNVQDIPGNSSSSRNSPSEFESVNNQNIVNSSKIIRLPENLMPQVLDQRQTNETEWFMEDFDDYEDKIGEHKSSDGSFLFFFK